MNEFTSIFSGDLATPEACRDCPRIHQLESNVAARHAAMERELAAAAFASPRTVRRLTLGDSDPQRAAADRKVADLFHSSDEFASQAQAEVAELTSDCIGPMRGELSTKLGTTAAVIVCGSAALDTGGQYETARVERGFARPTNSEE